MQEDWRPEWLKKHAESLRPDQAGRYIGLALQFGIAMALSLYLMVRLGSWLDARLGTGFLFMALGVVLAVASSLGVLIRRILEEEPEEPS